MTTPADSVWRVGFTEERAVVMSSRSGHTSMEVFSFEPAEMVAEKTAARARAREQAASQSLRDLKKKARTEPGMPMEVDEDVELAQEDGKTLWGGMDMVRESSEMSMGSVEEGATWSRASPSNATTAGGSSSSSSSAAGPSSTLGRSSPRPFQR
jgi:alkanesulfonate monooxygenase SsuD/methylene tetrahydromethanopterin reductase-like flavin-dependent oxidoreductase (luciferase family)